MSTGHSTQSRLDRLERHLTRLEAPEDGGAVQRLAWGKLGLWLAAAVLGTNGAQMAGWNLEIGRATETVREARVAEVDRHGQAVRAMAERLQYEYQRAEALEGELQDCRMGGP